VAVPFFRTTFSVSPVDGPDFYGAVIRHQRSFGAHKHTQRCVTSCTDCEGASFRWKLQRFAKCSRKPIIIKGGKWNLWSPRSDAVACYVLSQYVAIIQVFHGENDKPIYKPLGWAPHFRKTTYNNYYIIQKIIVCFPPQEVMMKSRCQVSMAQSVPPITWILKIWENNITFIGTPTRGVAWQVSLGWENPQQPIPSAGRSMKPNDLYSDTFKDRRESSSRSLCRAAWFTSPMGYSRNFTCQLLSVMNLLAEVPILAVLTNLSISLDCFDVNICAKKNLCFPMEVRAYPQMFPASLRHSGTMWLY
jgi:hypothetical protein